MALTGIQISEQISWNIKKKKQQKTPCTLFLGLDLIQMKGTTHGCATAGTPECCSEIPLVYVTGSLRHACSNVPTCETGSLPCQFLFRHCSVQLSSLFIPIIQISPHSL